MMASPTSFPKLATCLVLLTTCLSLALSQDDCTTLDAAFRFDSKLYLISGDNYYEIGDDMKEKETGLVSEKFDGPNDQRLSAATVWTGDDTLYFFYDTHYYYFSTWFSTTFGPYGNSRWTPFFLDGIDAAGKLGDMTYFFKGCDYIVYDGSYSEPREVHDLGFPCDVDAAWEQADFLVVVKGSESWLLSGDGQTRGPFKISQEITLNSISLCESNAKYDWATRNKLELEYEKEHECVIIDSAINYEGAIYLFNDDGYVRLNASGSEDLFGRNYDWGGLGSGVDAAVRIPEKDRGYFFQGDEYYAYYGLAFGPFSATDDWAPFFSTGIDAAGSRSGMTYFFQGCHVATYSAEDEAVLEINNGEEIGLPCNASAAFTKDDSLYVIKRDKVWIWDDGVTGPEPLSSVVNLTSWKICP